MQRLRLDRRLVVLHVLVDLHRLLEVLRNGLTARVQVAEPKQRLALPLHGSQIVKLERNPVALRHLLALLILLAKVNKSPRICTPTQLHRPFAKHALLVC